MNKDNRSRIAWEHYILVTILFCAAVISFYAFARESRLRIAEQNQRYAHDAAIQVAGRVEDMLEARATTLNLLSITVAETITQPWISQDFLKLLQETSVFDYVEFIDADGLNHNADGQTSDSSDRNNYLRGIQGETGFHIIYNSRITNETLINFYAPVCYHGEIIGVLNGMFREQSLRQAISFKFFDVNTKSLICTNDGTVISSYGYDSPVESLQNALAQDNIVAEEALSTIRDTFDLRDTLCYTAYGKPEDIIVSLIPIGDDWMLVQTFPSAVTRQMTASADNAGMKLELRLVTLFLIYVIYLLVTNLRRRRKLTSEKVRLGGIVEGLVPLFARLIILDAEQQHYEYLKGAPPGLPAHGTLDSLKQYMCAHYLRDKQSPSSTPPDLEEIRTSLDKGAPFVQYEYRICWETERWENAAVLSLPKKGGMPASLIFAIQDVTALRCQKDAIQQTLQDTFHTAEDLSRAKSDFLARMSHDMRTPMNAVLGMTSIAFSHLEDSAQVQDCLEKIESSGQQLLALINEVLDMSKIESGGLVLEEVSFHLPDEIDQVLHEAQNAAAQKNLRFHVSLTPFDHKTVLGDPEHFQQVLRNLLDNAVKYTLPGGSVTFSARELSSRALKSGYYEFVVEDTGIGITPSFQPKIFEPFAREESRSDNPGTGLGLSIAQTIVKLMSGDITVTSTPGQGSVFTVHVFFKLDEDSSEIHEAAQADAEKPFLPITRHAGIRVLLAEDIKVNMIIAQNLLKRAEILVETAENGAEAVALLQKNPPAYFDFVFMDLQMPVMNGYEATQAIRNSSREDLRRIPIVAVTANAFQEDVSRAKEMGMNDLVMKPVDLDKLLAALDKWLPFC